VARRRSPGRLTIDDIDLIEINEAFAAQVVPPGVGVREDCISTVGRDGRPPSGMPLGRITKTSIISLQYHDKQST
jgi:hypothetical protein